MSYVIEPIPLSMFIEDKIRLPRFQRKETWKKDQNFKLCISVFKEFPVGVVIINRENKVSWLLDGRQRKNALQKMRNDPNEVYLWAKAFLRFKSTYDEQALQSVFWKKIDEYLQMDPLERNQNEDTEPGDDEAEAGAYDEPENSFDVKKQEQGLRTLLNMILMVHPMRDEKGAWQRIFDFSPYFERLAYANPGGSISPEKLRDFLAGMVKALGGAAEITEDRFYEYFIDKNFLSHGKEAAFRKETGKRFDLIRRILHTIEAAEQVFMDGRIGAIQLTNASALDAQNIFSLVNTGGTELKAEELLSAKPFWNTPVTTSSPALTKHIDTLYTALGVSRPDDTVLWDLCATLLSRIDASNLFFAPSDNSEKVSLERISLGFKLVSGLLQGGISGKHVAMLETTASRSALEAAIEEIVINMGQLENLLFAHSFFSRFVEWKKPMQSLLGTAPTLEFLTILFKLREEENIAAKKSVALSKFHRNALILFDRLVFEYATKIWRGSSDSKFAGDIKNIPLRLESVPASDWAEFIQASSEGAYKGSDITRNISEPILYYYYCLKEIAPLSQKTEYDVDHIFSKKLIEASGNQDYQRLQDTVINLALLPRSTNSRKNAKYLPEMYDAWDKDTISRFTEVPVADFGLFDDVAHIATLREKRLALFLDAFAKRRTSLLENP